MAHTSAAKKSIRQNVTRRERNLSVLKPMRKAVHDVRKALTTAKKDEAKVLLAKAVKALDKAAAKGVVKKNLAARTKSRLTKAVNKLA